MTTGEDAAMATQNEVSLVVYGENKVSEEVVLGSGKLDGFFKEATTDEFKVGFQNVYVQPAIC